MKHLYCIGRVIELDEGYAKTGAARPRVVKMSMEPNPATPTMRAEATMDVQLAAGLDIGTRIRIDLGPAGPKDAPPPGRACNATLRQIAQGYPAKEGEPAPRVLKLEFYDGARELTALALEIALARELSEGLDVGQLVAVAMRPATEDEWAAFQAAVQTYQPRAIPAA